MLENFGSHVSGGTDPRERFRLAAAEDTRYTEICNLNIVVRIQENIRCLQIPMYYLVVVHLLNRETYLGKPSQDLIIIEEGTLILRFLVMFLALPDLRVQVTLLTIVHDDAEFATFGLKHVAVTNNEIILQDLEDLGFP